MKRGDFCEAQVPARTYARAHRCEVRHGIRKVGRRFLCGIHARGRGKPVKRACPDHGGQYLYWAKRVKKWLCRACLEDMCKGTVVLTAGGA